MSETRAPDPTLTAFASTNPLDDGYVVAVTRSYNGCSTAHRIARDDAIFTNTYACMNSVAVMDENQSYTDNARWFAVPCRECFPDAPEPGSCPCDLGGRTQGESHEHPLLAWQRQEPHPDNGGKP